MTSTSTHQILSPEDINKILKRMAFQILEQHPTKEAQLYLIGIEKNGRLLSERLYDIIGSINSKISVQKGSIKIDKTHPRSPVECSIPLSTIENACVVVVDDVLNTGSTLMYAIRHFLEIPLQQLQAAVLVNRSHKVFPVKAEIKGISLSTSMNEHVEVDLETSNGVLLM